MALLVFLGVANLGVGAEAGRGAPEYFKIRVVDEETGRGVPLVELETVHHLLYVTDSAGVAAFSEPALMNREVFFHVRSHGYEFPKDGFGFAGTRLLTRPGGQAELKIRRINLAERLYRVTGEGIYRDSLLVGDRPPLAEPLLNGEVAGQDSVMAVPYRGEIYWFWGDTLRPKYPLGHFRTAGATSKLPGQGGLSAQVGVDLRYFTAADGFSRPLIEMAGPGPVWLDGVLTLPDGQGRERLVGHYRRMKDLGTVLEHGLVVFNDAENRFDKLRELPLSDPVRCPRDHPVRYREESGDYFYFPAPFPFLRVKADWQSLLQPERYEVFSVDGAGEWAWRGAAAPTDQGAERKLIAAGRLAADRAHWQVKDAATGKAVEVHASSVSWNGYRKRWAMIFTQKGGTSHLGEVWYSEADSLTGPWREARKVVTHHRYSFYNPEQHPFLAEEGGRYLYFEGTYAGTFSGNPVATPRYDYNQMMYRLDLADPRLGLERR